MDIGLREAGRIKPDNVIWSDVDRKSIKKSIELALSDEFEEKIQSIDNPYYKKGTSKAIREILEELVLDQTTMKEFFDIDFKF